MATYLSHGIIHSYTLECNYNTSRIGNDVAMPSADPKSSIPDCPVTATYDNAPGKYVPSSYHSVGRACLISMLDIRGFNPCSRVPNTHFGDLKELYLRIESQVMKRKEYRLAKRLSTAQTSKGMKNQNCISNNETIHEWRPKVSTMNVCASSSSRRSFANKWGACLVPSGSEDTGKGFSFPVVAIRNPHDLETAMCSHHLTKVTPGHKNREDVSTPVNPKPIDMFVQMTFPKLDEVGIAEGSTSIPTDTFLVPNSKNGKNMTQFLAMECQAISQPESILLGDSLMGPRVPPRPPVIDASVCLEHHDFNYVDIVGEVPIVVEENTEDTSGGTMHRYESTKESDSEISNSALNENGDKDIVHGNATLNLNVCEHILKLEQKPPKGQPSSRQKDYNCVRHAAQVRVIPPGVEHKYGCESIAESFARTGLMADEIKTTNRRTGQSCLLLPNHR